MDHAQRPGVRRSSAAFRSERGVRPPPKRQRAGAVQNLSVIAGGGGTSTNSQFALTGTLAQPDRGATMSESRFSLAGGFWGIIVAVQTPGAPLLTITRSGNSVIVTWLSPSADFGLQQNSNVANTNGWSAYGDPVNDNGTVKSVTVNPATGKWFFRCNRKS